MGIFEELRQDLNLLKQEVQELKKENSILQRGLTTCVGESEAIRITGFSRSALYQARKEGRLQDVGEGKKVLYLRSELIALTDEKKPRTRLRLSA